ncbi:MAG: hypothetical protein KBD37_08720 [Burkholderiales bacterium]|nr:hypothetical protein [Burkholderiales bacterium]
MRNNSLLRSFSVAIIIWLVLNWQVYHGFNLIQLLRGVVSSLSFVSVWLLIRLCLRFIFLPGVGRLIPTISYHFAAIICLLGSLLYLTTFGILPFDLYGYGYFPGKIGLAVFFIVELYLWFYAREYAVIWLIALGGFYFKICGLSNLWDYLLDPLIWMIACMRLIYGCYLYYRAWSVSKLYNLKKCI